jgi:hypothetical protein
MVALPALASVAGRTEVMRQPQRTRKASSLELPGNPWHFQKLSALRVLEGDDVKFTLAAKLRMTAELLGCASQKELCQRFRAVNPATGFDVERSHKWMQGRAMPRDPRVYDDWARVLGTERPGAWLAECSLEEFRAELSGLFGRELGVIAPRPVLATARVPSAEQRWRHLLGSFACYSHAWSRYHAGRIIRGELLIESIRGEALNASYAEALETGAIHFAGEAWPADRTLHLALRETASRLPLFASLFLPGPPGSVLGGIRSGATFLGQEPQPTAVRLLAVRVSDTAALRRSNRYLRPGQDTIAADLAALGVPVLDPGALEEAARAALGRGEELVDAVPFSVQVRLAELLDRGWINQAGAAAAAWPR